MELDRRVYRPVPGHYRSVYARISRASQEVLQDEKYRQKNHYKPWQHHSTVRNLGR